LIDFLREKRVLLVVDNCEHLISQASFLLELLESSPGVKIMVTSRERLNLYGEWVLEVTGMSYPEGTPGDDELESYLSANAIELFLKNARRIHPGFTANPDDLVEIIRICQMVEGMPLGIELASSWVKVLPIGEIRREINGNLDFLSSQMTGSPERHSSMRMVFEHSWNLLKEPEKKALIKLSIFKGAFSREAARMIAGTGLNILSALMDKSLLYRSDRRVQASEGIWGYYQMHDLVKQYATEKLGEVPHEKTATVEEYTQYFCRRLWESRTALHSHDQERAMRRLESEIDDIRAAYYYAVQQENLNLMQQAFHSLVVFHDMKGWLNELRDLLHTGLRKLHEIRSARGASNQINGLYALYLAGYVNYSSLVGRTWDPAKAKEALDILNSLENPDEYLHGYILLTFGAELINPPEAFDLCQKSMAAFHQQGDLWAISASQMAFAYYCWRADDHNLALELWREALKNTRKIGDRFGIASCLDAIAQISYEKGDYPTALDYAQEALEIHHTMGGHWRQINDLMLLGQIFTALGDYQVAERHYLAGMDLARETGNRRIIAIHHDCLGYVSMLTGRYTEAEANYQDSLALYQQEDASPGMGFVYNNLGDIARKRGKNDEARKRYLRGLDILANTSESSQWRDWGRILLHKKLGILDIEEDNYTAAQNNLSQALKLAWDMERTPEVLDILIGIAELWARQGQPVKALELTVIVSNHPATAQEAKERAGKLTEALSKTLPEKDVAAAFTAGAAADFDQFMLSLPEIYESLSSPSDRGNP
jgi:predicted ATPase